MSMHQSNPPLTHSLSLLPISSWLSLVLSFSLPLSLSRTHFLSLSLFHVVFSSLFFTLSFMPTYTLSISSPSLSMSLSLTHTHTDFLTYKAPRSPPLMPPAEFGLWLGMFEFLQGPHHFKRSKSSATLISYHTFICIKLRLNTKTVKGEGEYKK